MALRRNGIVSSKRLAAGSESCKQDSFLCNRKDIYGDNQI